MAASGLRLDRTLGPLVVDWIESMLVHGPGDVQGQRVELDDEQVKFVLAAYAIDDFGRRLIRRAVFSRPKGRAKSELAALLVCAEALGPVRFRGWDHDGRPLGGAVQPAYIPLRGDRGDAGRHRVRRRGVHAPRGCGVGDARSRHRADARLPAGWRE